MAIGLVPPATQSLQDVVKMSTALRETIVTAESCTAGALATLIADTPEAGDMFAGGFVTYAKACKEVLLGVPSNLLEQETAVSAEVALEMARGALRSCVVADIAVAVTCVGGPKADEDGNPVGLTHIAVCHRDEAFARTSETYAGTSSEIRAQVLDAAANLLRSFLSGRCPS
jgi:nicotinamide-nucleotide amidase